MIYYKRLIKIIFCVSLIVVCKTTYAQNDIDEINHAKTLYHLNRDIDKDSIQFCINKLKTSKNQCRALFGKLHEAGYYYNDNKYEASIKLLDEILYEIKNNPQPNTFVYSKIMVGKTYNECIKVLKLNVYRRFFFLKKNEKKLTEAYDYLLLMDTIVNNLNNKDIYYLKNKISTTFSLASLKKVIGQEEESLEILLRLNSEMDTIDLKKDNVWYNNFQKEKANINVQISRNYMNLGKTKKSQKLFSLAEDYSNKAYTITKLIDSTSTRNITAHYFRMAELSTYKDDYYLALKFADSSSKHVNKAEFNSALYTIKSVSHSKLKHPDSAIYYANKIVNNKNHVGLRYNFTKLYTVLAESYFIKKELDSAYKYSQLSLNQYNKKSKEENTTLNALNTAELSEANFLNQSIIKKRNALKRSFTIISITSFLILICIIIYNIRKRKILNKKIDSFKLQLQKQKQHKPNKKELVNPIDNLTITRILNDLNAIENSEIFLSQDFNLGVLAKTLNTNTSYLSKIINQHKKKSFKQYLIELRIAALLNNLDKNPIMRKYSIEALAESIGYTNASSFTRIFKNYLGENPSSFLNKKYPERKR